MTDQGICQVHDDLLHFKIYKTWAFCTCTNDISKRGNLEKQNSHFSGSEELNKRTQSPVVMKMIYCGVIHKKEVHNVEIELLS